MRIVSYNILNGGEGRADPLAEVLLAQRADVVALIEADNIEVVERISRRLKMDFIHAAGTHAPERGGHSAAILSRYDIIETINHAKRCPSGPRSMVEATVRDSEGAEWPIVAVHFSAGAFEADEATRETELAALMNVTADHRAARRSHLIVGDFNSDAPEQLIDPANCKPATQKAWAANGGEVPRRIISKMLEAGYHDSLSTIEPQQARSAASFSTRHPAQRVDYIFMHSVEPARLRSAWIETDRLATYASDHYPVGAEIV